MVKAEDLCLITCDIPTRVFIEKVSEDLCKQGLGSGEYGSEPLIRATLDDTHLLVYPRLLEPLKKRMDERNRENTFERDPS
jgi:hypothetical protein